MDAIQNRLVCVVAMAQNYVIGDGTGLIWHLPGDLQRVKRLTMGCPLIMGRKTYQSIGRALPGRLNIVMTRNAAFSAEGVVSVISFQEALIAANAWLAEQYRDSEIAENRIILFGGGEIYRIGLEYCNEIDATIVEDDSQEGVRFPELDSDQWHDDMLEQFAKTDSHPAFSYHKLTRKIPSTALLDLKISKPNP